MEEEEMKYACCNGQGVEGAGGLLVGACQLEMKLGKSFVVIMLSERSNYYEIALMLLNQKV